MKRRHITLYAFAVPVVVGLLLMAPLLIGSGKARSAELLVVDRPNCPYCKAWEIEVGRIYPKTAEGAAAPLRRVDISEVPDLRYDFREPVIYAPTFILIDRGEEIGRITGYSDEAAFWGMLMELLEANKRLIWGRANEARQRF